MTIIHYVNPWVRNGICFLCLTGLIYADFWLDDYPEKEPFLYAFCALSLFYAIVLIHNTLLIKRFLLIKKYRLYAAALISYLILILGILMLIAGVVQPQDKLDLLSDSLSTILAIVILPWIGSCVYFAHLWLLDNVIHAQQKLLNAETQLAYLKLQLNPHFLLNALNNLYGTALATPADVPDKITELAHLLTYQIETSKKESIALPEEIAFISRYLEYVQWKTYGIRIEIDLPEVIPHYSITPMVFLPLVENATKYAATAIDPFCDVRWTLLPNRLEFCIINSFRPNNSSLTSTQTGLDNLRRRLILYHPDHRLTTHADGYLFTAKLTLWNLRIAA